MVFYVTRENFCLKAWAVLVLWNNGTRQDQKGLTSIQAKQGDSSPLRLQFPKMLKLRTIIDDYTTFLSGSDIRSLWVKLKLENASFARYLQGRAPCAQVLLPTPKLNILWERNLYAFGCRRYSSFSSNAKLDHRANGVQFCTTTRRYFEHIRCSISFDFTCNTGSCLRLSYPWSKRSPSWCTLPLALSLIVATSSNGTQGLSKRGL